MNAPRRRFPVACVRGSSLDDSAPAVARIDLAAVRANAAEARRLAGGRDVIAVVKANAYGHGVVPVSRLDYRLPVAN